MEHFIGRGYQGKAWWFAWKSHGHPDVRQGAEVLADAIDDLEAETGQAAPLKRNLNAADLAADKIESLHARDRHGGGRLAVSE